MNATSLLCIPALLFVLSKACSSQNEILVFLARERESWKVFWVPPFLFVPLFLSFVTHLNSLAARNKDETRRGANSAKQITSSS